MTKFLIRAVLSNADCVTAVSAALGKAMQDFYAKLETVIVPNVVDQDIFYPAKNPPGKHPFTLVHISNFFFQKNTDDILRAFLLLNQNSPGRFKLIMAGGKLDAGGANSLWKQSGVEFLDQMPQEELAEIIRNSHALILYSHYETFGCVIIEAMACGLPVVVSDIEVFHENVRENVNGFFAKPGDPASLADKLEALYSDYEKLDRISISRSALDAYSFKRVGKIFSDIYRRTSAATL